jgi:hypothetical protein
MTREQALIAVGYPAPDLTPSISNSVWRYRNVNNDEFDLVWDETGHLQAVRAEEHSAVNLIVLQ